MNRAFFWIIFFFVAMLVLYLLSNTLAPFVIAFIFAYLLQPAIDANCRRFNLPRWFVTFGIFSLFLSSFIIALLLLVPMIYQQVALFITKIPNYKSNFEQGTSFLMEKFYKIDPDMASKVSDSLQSFINNVFVIIGSFANHLWEYTMATINFFAIIALVPVILYYFLRDWPTMVDSIESLLPMRGKSKVREIFVSINELLSAYIRGQLNICLLLSLYYIIGLSIIGLDLAVLLGIISGFFIIVPFIGVMISFLLVFISAYFSYGAGIQLVYISLIFAIGHVIESYILSPKIIGERIGLHPVWIIFAVFAGGSLFGFVGILFAVPIAGIIKVLLTHLLSYYKSSKIFSD